MSLAVIRSRSLDGLDAPEVTVEVHLANGLPSFTLVGLADTEVKEARVWQRIGCAQGPLSNQEVSGVICCFLRQEFAH
jgi:magnesium chelatase family protein